MNYSYNSQCEWFIDVLLEDQENWDHWEVEILEREYDSIEPDAQVPHIQFPDTHLNWRITLL